MYLQTKGLVTDLLLNLLIISSLYYILVPIPNPSTYYGGYDLTRLKRLFDALVAPLEGFSPGFVTSACCCTPNYSSRAQVFISRIIGVNCPNPIYSNIYNYICRKSSIITFAESHL